MRIPTRHSRDARRAENSGTLMHSTLLDAESPPARTTAQAGFLDPSNVSSAGTFAREPAMTSPANFAERIERLRQYLTLLARMQIGAIHRQNVDASGIVNATLFTAYEQREQFRGTNDAELAAWLRRMLACNLADAFRGLRRGKRDVRREQPLDGLIDRSHTRLEDWLVAIQTSPSAQAVREEELLRLAWALGELSAAQREAVELHHLHGRSIQEVAELLGRTKPSVAGLLRTGLKRLRELLDEQESRP
jgi:RNA polymerase sigma-70 factor (ECF subfamily)